MVSGFAPVTQADQVKQPQYVVEGDILTTPANYGTVPDNPSFTAVGSDGVTLQSSYAPVKDEKRKTGNIDRVGKITHKKKYTANLVFKATDNNTGLQQWCVDKSVKADTDTPAASITLVQSYNVAGTETFEILKGCLPTSVSISIDGQADITYTVGLMVQDRTETTSSNGGLTLGSGSFATADTSVAWLADDGGTNHFTYNSNNYALSSMSISVNHDYAMVSPTENQLDIFAKESMRNISGTIDVIKSNSVILADAFADTQRSMSIVLKASTLTMSFTNVLLDSPDGVSLDPKSTDSLIESFNFDADTVTTS